MTQPTEQDRQEFESWVSRSPYEYSIDRYPDSAAFPGTYKSIRVDLAWHAWQEAQAKMQSRVAELEAKNAARVAPEIIRPVYPVMPDGEDAAEVRRLTAENTRLKLDLETAIETMAGKELPPAMAALFKSIGIDATSKLTAELEQSRRTNTMLNDELKALRQRNRQLLDELRDKG